MSETETEVGLTDAQRAEVIQLMRGYFGSDTAKQQAQDAAKSMMDLYIEHNVKAQIYVLMDKEPEKLIAQLFQRSGQVVKTEASAELDRIIAAVMKDEDSGIPAAIREHVKKNLIELVQRSVSEIIAAMVVDYLKTGAGGATDATRDLIRIAFQNASMNTRY